MGNIVKSKKFGKWKISFLNEQELDEMENELYKKRFYNFSISNAKPIIFDVGALIGETVLFFKDLYPESKIVAFEPSPRSFKLLKTNIKQNNLKNVTLINAAVSGKSGKMNFYTSKSDINPWGRGDSLKENRFNSKELSRVVKVNTVKLSRYIKNKIDLLKIDIEGAETEVIKEIEPKLNKIDQIILEYHGNNNPDNDFWELMGILQLNKYKIKIFFSRWLLPIPIIYSLVILFPILGINEYWLRIYAKH